MTAHAYTEDQIVEQPAMALFAALQEYEKSRCPRIGETHYD
jgi:hypothetical protein